MSVESQGKRMFLKIEIVLHPCFWWVLLSVLRLVAVLTSLLATRNGVKKLMYTTLQQRLPMPLRYFRLLQLYVLWINTLYVLWINTLMSGLIQAVRKKTADSHVSLCGNISTPVRDTDLVEASKDGASLVVCTWKNFLLGGCGLFVSDVISGGLVGHLDQLHLALGANRYMVVFRWWCYWILDYNPSLLILWMTCWVFGFKSYDLS